MRESIRTGETTWERRGQSVFRWLAEQPEDGQQFARAMSHLNCAVHIAVAESYDCSNVKTMVDVGGAHGSLLREFLIRYPHLHGILFDLPQIAEGATEALNAAGLGHRVQCIGGDFFEAVPEGGDLYLLSLILHDWGDDNAERVLRSCRKAMTSDARLLISEIVLPNDNVAHSGFVMDLKMLVHTSGRERTLDEYNALLERTGFKLLACKPTVADSSIIEAMPI
jgi:SAM-dependent methyltransferase